MEYVAKTIIRGKLTNYLNELQYEKRVEQHDNLL